MLVDIDEEDERLKLVFGCEEIPEVSEKALREYRRYLSKHLSPGCCVTGREDFLWEEIYVMGPGDPEEYEELKKERPSYTDKYKVEKLNAEPSSEYDIVAIAKRVSDGKRFEIGLAWLEAIDEKSSDYQLLEDFGSWQVNWR